MLLAAGVITAALLAYKTYNGGSLRIPPDLYSLLSPTKNKPLERNFPSVNNATGIGTGIAEMPAETSPTPPASATSAADGREVSAPIQEAGTNPIVGVPTFTDEDVNSRIARAMELSRNLSAGGEGLSAKLDSGLPPASANAAYAGSWSGEYTGPDAGTVSVAVGQDGSALGQGVSTLTGISFEITGKVQNNGQVQLVQTAAGATSTGATFSGALTRAGQGSGTWEASSYNLSGAWRLAVKVP